MDGDLITQEKLFIIERLPLFANLSLRDKKFVARLGSLVEYKKNAIVYKESDLADAFYCVVTGRLKVYVTRKDRREDLEHLERGKYFGIISLLTGEPHSVTAQAINDSIILKIPKEGFDELLKRIPQLAIHLSQTLSRRLKRKDIHEKSIFESTIIAVFGISDKIGTTTYAINLGVSLKLQTGKKIILLDIKKAGGNISTILGIGASSKPVLLDSPFFDEEAIKASIFEGPLGLDIINIQHRIDDPKDASNIIPLLSYLTNDYHYVILDLPSYMDKTTFESLKQSDMMHIITSADGPSLYLTGKLTAELEKSSDDICQKIKVITTEYGIIKLVEFANRKEVLKHDIFATLPDINKSACKIDKSKAPIVIEYPDCEYSKAIRRITREVSGSLIGLALGSGAALGLAHIGILKVIEKENIPIDIVAGTSMGALIGALWASGRNASEIEEVTSRFKRIKTLSLMDLTFPRKGLIKGGAVRRFLRSQFGNGTFYDLKLPFKAVACDIEKREEVVLDKGFLVDAIMASIAIPGVFEPVVVEGRLLVDGGIVNPLPTNILMKAGVTKIIAVNTIPSPEDVQKHKKKVSNIFDIIVNSIQASEYLLAEISCQGSDIVMHPVLPAVDWYELYESPKIIKRGEEEALKYVPQLKELMTA